MTYLILLLFSLNETGRQTSEQQCIQMFDKQKFSKVTSICSKIDNPSTKLSMIIVTSEFFQKIPYIRVNEIFHHGTGGQYLYELAFKKNLLTKYEENTLNEYFGQFKKFADSGEPIAQILTAKLFYITEYILKSDEPKFNYNNFYKMKQKLYTNNLDKYIQVFPDDLEVLYLLGVEGVENTYEPNDKNVYYEITNQRYYDYLKKANELNHPKSQEYINGVIAWKNHLKIIEKQANNNDADALTELGSRLYFKEKGNKENLSKAILYFTSAAKQNHIKALRWLTRIYSQDSPNLEKYLKAQNILVKLNDSDSILSLGDFYLCNKEIDKAKKLYQKAKHLNHPLAQIALEDLKYDGEPSHGCR